LILLNKNYDACARIKLKLK